MAKILMADDEQALLVVLVAMLEADGHTVTTVVNGNALVAEASAGYDLVITDLIMPGKEGIEAILELRKVYPKLKIIAMSGGGRVGPENYLKLALKLGATAALEKPFDRDKLVTLVRKVLAA
jgi:DNA-binding NtrC family response regulator